MQKAIISLTALFLAMAGGMAVTNRGVDTVQNRNKVTTQEEASGETDNNETTGSDTSNSEHTGLDTGKTDKAEAKAAKLTALKLKACQKRETSINNILARMVDRDRKRMKVFDKISEKVQAFYDDKGYSVDSYQNLLDTLSEKREAALSQLDELEGTSLTFKCDGSDPKGIVSQFKNRRAFEVAALKEYKTAVKNLISKVRSAHLAATSSDESEDSSESDTNTSTDDTNTEGEQ